MSPRSRRHARRAALLLSLPLLLAGCDRLRPKPAAEAESGAQAPGAPAGETKPGLGLRVRLALLTELGVDGTRVKVNADKGRIRLSGEVQKRATAELAERVAKSVEGVREVESRIRVVDAPAGATAQEKAGELLAEAERELADAALETRVRIALVDRLGSDGFRIGTQAADGVVTLEFPRAIERARRRDARRIATEVEGVSKVVTLERQGGAKPAR